MEILNSAANKRTVLIVSCGEPEIERLAELVETEYRVVMINGKDRNFGEIRAAAGSISAAIVGAGSAAADDYALFRWLRSDSIANAVPLLIYCTDDASMQLAEGCLERGAIDVIMPPLNRALVMQRIRNGLRIKDSTTFYEIERMLRELPSNIFLKDAEGKYVFATHYWHHLDHGDDPDWTIRGKTDLEIRKDRENAIKAMEADKKILETGIGTDYVIEINADGVQEFMNIIKQPVRDEEGNITGIIALINDVTEQELLRMSLEKKALQDELTGVGNRRGFDQFLEGLASGALYPISIISADCNELKAVNDTYGHLVGDEYIRMSALLFRTVLPENTRIFRTGGDEFVIILPQVGREQAAALVARLKEEEKHFSLRGRNISISYGVSCMEHTDLQFQRYLDAADQEMYTNKKKHKQHLRAGR